MKTLHIRPDPERSDLYGNIFGDNIVRQAENEMVLTKIYCQDNPLDCVLQVHIPQDCTIKAAMWAGRFIEAGDLAGMKTETIWEGEE